MSYFCLCKLKKELPTTCVRMSRDGTRCSASSLSRVTKLARTAFFSTQ